MDSEHNPLSILLIERDDEERKRLTQILIDEEYSVLAVSDVSEATTNLQSGGIGLIISAPPNKNELSELYSALGSIDPGLPVIIYTKEQKKSGIISSILSLFSGSKAVRVPTLIDHSTIDENVRALMGTIQSSVKRPNLNEPSPSKLYFEVPSQSSDEIDIIRRARRELETDPDNVGLANLVASFYAQRAISGDLRGIRKATPSRHLIYWIAYAGEGAGVTKLYRTGERAFKIEKRNYEFFQDVNTQRREFLKNALSIDADYLHLAKIHIPPSSGGYHLIRLPPIKGDLLYDRCWDEKATTADLRAVGIQLARFQVEGTNAFKKDNLKLIDVVESPSYSTVTDKSQKVNRDDDGNSIYFLNRLDDVFFGQLEKYGGVKIDSHTKAEILKNYFINRILVQAHPKFSECYIDGNPRDWIMNSYATKLDLENDRFCSEFLDIVSLLEFGINRDSHTVPMSESEKINILDRIMLEKVRARAVISEDVKLIKKIDEFVEGVEGKDIAYANHDAFYELISGGTQEQGERLREEYTALYYAASCHKNPEWAGHKAKFASEAQTIAADLDENDPFRKRLRTDIIRYTKEQLDHVLRVDTNIDIMLKRGFVPDDLLQQAQLFRDNWLKMRRLYFK